MYATEILLKNNNNTKIKQNIFEKIFHQLCNMVI